MVISWLMAELSAAALCASACPDFISSFFRRVGRSHLSLPRVHLKEAVYSVKWILVVSDFPIHFIHPAFILIGSPNQGTVSKLYFSALPSTDVIRNDAKHRARMRWNGVAVFSYFFYFGHMRIRFCTYAFVVCGTPFRFVPVYTQDNVHLISNKLAFSSSISNLMLLLIRFDRTQKVLWWYCFRLTMALVLVRVADVITWLTIV